VSTRAEITNAMATRNPKELMYWVKFQGCSMLSASLRKKYKLGYMRTDGD
jgi:hypothetical protein